LPTKTACKGEWSITIVGAGVAGSVLSYLLAREGVGEVRVYELSEKYTKPCGEVVPARLIGILEENSLPKPPLLREIKHFKFYSSSGRLLREYTSDEPVWYAIDKQAWVMKLRSMIPLELRPIRNLKSIVTNECDVAVDARGPFAALGSRVVVWRAYSDYPLDSAIVVFDFEKTGFAWAFPHGAKSNIGGGFMGVKEPRNLALDMLTRLAGIPKDSVFNEKYSLVTILPRIRLYSKRILRVGEAAGLIQSLGGEGIRPAVESAIALYKSFKISRDIQALKRNYVNITRELRKEALIGKYMLRLAMLTGKSAERMFHKLPRDFFDAWLSGGLRSWRLFFEAILNAGLKP
jgi:flavin-dependent dehydrogenase